MIINSSGFTLSTLQEYLTTWTNKLKTVFGNDFVIKKEGVVDNIATASSLSCMDLENQFAFLIKQLNPRTAEGEWQDQLYSLIGLIRRQATHTVVSRTCEGTPNTTIAAGALIIENSATKDQFRNNDEINFDNDGLALGSFTAEESGSIDLPNDAIINIITPFSNLSGVYYTTGNTIIKGVDYESNTEFRERWLLSSSSQNANTDDGLYKALLELVETKSDLRIFTNRTDSTVDGIPPHCLRIVLNSAYDDETIAQTIFDHIVDGNMYGLQGDEEVEITDSEGSTETIRFDRADVLPIYIKIEVTIKDGAYLASAQADIKNNINKYVTEHKFDMGSKLYANMFATPAYAASEVSGITLIKLSDDGETWTDSIQLTSTEVPTFDSTRILVYEES